MNSSLLNEKVRNSAWQAHRKNIYSTQKNHSSFRLDNGGRSPYLEMENPSKQNLSRGAERILGSKLKLTFRILLESDPVISEVRRMKDVSNRITAQ